MTVTVWPLCGWPPSRGAALRDPSSWMTGAQTWDGCAPLLIWKNVLYPRLRLYSIDRCGSLHVARPVTLLLGVASCATRQLYGEQFNDRHHSQSLSSILPAMRLAIISIADTINFYSRTVGRRSPAILTNAGQADNFRGYETSCHRNLRPGEGPESSLSSKVVEDSALCGQCLPRIYL